MQCSIHRQITVSARKRTFRIKPPAIAKCHNEGMLFIFRCQHKNIHDQFMFYEHVRQTRGVDFHLSTFDLTRRPLDVSDMTLCGRLQLVWASTRSVSNSNSARITPQRGNVVYFEMSTQKHLTTPCRHRKAVTHIQRQRHVCRVFESSDPKHIDECDHSFTELWSYLRKDVVRSNGNRRDQPNLMPTSLSLTCWLAQWDGVESY